MVTKKVVILLSSIITFIIAVILLGCQSAPEKTEIEPVKFEPRVYPEAEVRLSPGDVLEIRFFYTPELNVTQTIRPDGKIMLQLIGEVEAQGKTPNELKGHLHNLYQEHLRQLDVTVIVQIFSNRRIFVGGQVESAGSIPMPGELTALEAIMLAGGIDLENGSYDNVVILRHNGEKWEGGKLDLQKALNGEKVDPFYLKPLDIVYVPERQIVEINRWIDQHLDRILPSVGFTYTIVPGGQDTLGISINPTIGE
jgi:protein involved in polysaccharide export with SLBB domain